MHRKIGYPTSQIGMHLRKFWKTQLRVRNLLFSTMPGLTVGVFRGDLVNSFIGLVRLWQYGATGPLTADNSAPLKGLFYGGGTQVLVAQMIGSAVVTLATFAVAMVVMLAVNATGALRLLAEAELYGMDVDLLPKIKLEIVLGDKLVDNVVDTIMKAASTGRIGDGKIFLFKIDEVIRIRNDERSGGTITREVKSITRTEQVC